MEHLELFREIRKIEIVTRQLVNDQLSGQYQSVFKGRGMAFDEVRKYQVGDDVRLIDWNVSARMNDVFVKLFVEEREMTVILMVDGSASGGFGTTHQTKSYLSAKIGATLAFSAIKNNDQVGLIIFTDKVEKFIPPKKGRKHVLRVVSEILRFTPSSPGTNLKTSLDYLGRIARQKAVAFLISDFQDENYEKALRLSNSRHDLIPVCISDPREENLSDIGVVYMEDPETGEVLLVDTSSKKMRESFAMEVKRNKAALKKLFRKLKIDFVEISTSDRDMNALVNFFRVRAKRARRA